MTAAHDGTGVRRRRASRRRFAIAAAAAAAVAGALLAGVGGAGATTLLSPASGARDTAMAGTTVAAPSDLMSALFENPAGLTLLDGTQVTGGGGLMLVENEVRTPSGYRGESHSLGMAPSLGASTARGRWHVAIGLFGSVGSKFDFPADPAHGVPRGSYTELGAITLAPTIAYELTPTLAVGVQVNPLFGSLTNRVPTPAQELRWRVQGPGIQGVVGILYTPDPRVRLAVTYKTPGEIFMEGSVGVAGKREHLRFDFDVPQQVLVGIAWRPLPRLLLTAAGEWSDTSAFERSRFEFSDTPALNFAFAPAVHDVFRGGAGVEYQAHPNVAVRAGFARGQAALEPPSVSPLVYDLAELIFGGGVGVDVGVWTVDLAGGYGIADDRKINAGEARLLPGRYTGAGPVGYAQLTRRF